MKTFTLMTALAITQNANATRPATTEPGINLRREADDGIFSIQLIVTGAGTVKVEYLLSHDGVNFLEPSSATDIITGFTVGSGPNADGKDIYSFEPELAPYMRLKVTEANVGSVVVTLILAVA